MALQNIYEVTMLERMQQQKPVPRLESTGVITDSTFISNSAAAAQPATVRTTATTHANLTLKLLQMKRDRERENAARRDAVLEAMNEAAEKRAEEAELKRQELQQRKDEAAARRREAAKEKKELEKAAKREAADLEKAAKREAAEAKQALL